METKKLKLQSNQSFVNALETGSIILILLWGDGIYVSPSMSFIIPILNVVSYLIVAILVLSRFKRIIYIATKDIPLLLLFGLASFSILWSENITYSVDYFIAIFRTTLLGAYIAACYSPKKQMWLLFLVGIIASILSLAVGLTIPSGEAWWLGIYSHKNYFARMMIFAAITSLIITLDIRRYRYRWVTIAAFFLAVALLLLSQGKTGLAVFLISLCFVPFYQIIVKQPYRLRVIIFTTSLIIFIFIAVLVLNNIETIVIDWMGKDLEFNGRSPIWERVIPKIWDRPLLGYGIHGFWSSQEGLNAARGLWIESFLIEGLGMHSHNGYLDLLLDLGFVGLLLFSINLVSILNRILYLLFTTQKIEYFWMLQFILISPMYQMAEIMTILTNSYLWAFYVSISLSTAIAYSNRHRKKTKFVLRA